MDGRNISIEFRPVVTGRIKLMEQVMEQAMDSWENEGGASRAPAQSLIGTVNQVEWAGRIKASVSVDFDRVANALETAAGHQTERDRMDTRALIAILEEKRAEVMAKDHAAYFIRDWQELRDQVRQMIAQDPRYQAIKANRILRRDLTRQL
jgi:hypothetical protein